MVINTTRLHLPNLSQLGKKVTRRQNPAALLHSRRPFTPRRSLHVSLPIAHRSSQLTGPAIGQVTSLLGIQRRPPLMTQRVTLNQVGNPAKNQLISPAASRPNSPRSIQQRSHRGSLLENQVLRLRQSRVLNLRTGPRMNQRLLLPTNQRRFLHIDPAACRPNSPPNCLPMFQQRNQHDGRANSPARSPLKFRL